MASLTGQSINTTYNGLLKTSANTALAGMGVQAITDGDGNNSPISLSQSEVYITSGATGNIEITGDLVTVTDDAQATGFQITAGSMGFAGNVDFSGATVTGLPGGGSTPAMELLSLPPMRTGSLTKKWNSWVPTTGYATGNCLTTLASEAELSVWPMREAQEINKVKFNVRTAIAGANANVAIYEVTTDAVGNMVPGNKLKDLGSVSAATTGNKTIDITSDPFVMPSGATYGAVIIAVSMTIDGVRFSSWSNSIWSGNSGVDYGDTTTYRTISWKVSSGLNAGVLPSDLSGGSYVYLGSTNDPMWIFTS